jgi:two-component system OmpR family sensor kinase
VRLPAFRLPKFFRGRSRLALRVYAIGLFQFIVVAALMEVEHRSHARQPFSFSENQAQFVSGTLARVLDDPKALQAEVDRAGQTFGWGVDVHDADGKVLAHAEPSTTGPSARRVSNRAVRVGFSPIVTPDGRVARMDYSVYPRLDGRGPPASPFLGWNGVFVLFVVGVASWLIARSIIRPIDRLATAARSFGEGRLDARADIVRTDEIGDTARAFNDMADRIAKLLLTERELLANVSHELRTPLARIRVALDLASEGNPHDAVESLREIAQDLAELEGIVDDVLASARLALDTNAPTSALPVKAERLETRALLEKSASKFRSAHPNRELNVRLADDLPPIMGDGVLMRRVVDNLLDNAHKYTDKPEESIALSAHVEGDDVLIEVSDRGVGIAESDVERLFEPFFRVDRSRTRTTGGLGLGLALARRVVDAHKGTITFASKLGAGTVACVRIPMYRDSVR